MEFYPMRRDMVVRIEKKEGGGFEGIISSCYGESRFPYTPRPGRQENGMRQADDFLLQMLERTNMMIDIWDKNYGNDDRAYGYYCGKKGLDPDDPESRGAFDADCVFLHERMDVLFEDAENFVNMVTRNGASLGYCVFGGERGKPELVLAYRDNECVASLPLDTEENRKLGRILARACRNLAKSDFDQAVARMVPAISDEALKKSWEMHPLECELSRERPFSQPARRQKMAQ